MKKSYFIYLIVFVIFLVGCQTQPQAPSGNISHSQNTSPPKTPQVLEDPKTPQVLEDPKTPQVLKTQNVSEAPTVPETQTTYPNSTIISQIKLWDHQDHTRLTLTFAGNLPQNIAPEPVFAINIQNLVLANSALSPLCRSIKSSKFHHEIACKHERFGDVKIFVTPNSIKIETPPGVKSFSSKQLDNPYRISYNLYDSATPPPPPPLILQGQSGPFEEQRLEQPAENVARQAYQEPHVTNNNYQEAPAVSEDVIVDSNYTYKDIIDAAKRRGTPRSIVRRLEVVEVRYYSFDGKIHQGQLVIDKRLAGDIKKIFRKILEIKFPIKSVIPISDPRFNFSDDRSMRANNTSAFNYRRMVGGRRLSKHASGIALDINPLYNPYIKGRNVQPRGAKYIVSRPGTLTRSSPVVRAFKRLGWRWGGDWRSLKDYQHFEKRL